MAVAAITVVYTFLGGMKAVIWTDVIQFSVYILGAIVALMILAGKLPGGWSELMQTARAAAKFRLFDFSLDLTQPIYVLGWVDWRDGAEHGDPRGRSDDGPTLSLGALASDRPPRHWWPAALSSSPSSRFFSLSASVSGCFTGVFPPSGRPRSGPMKGFTYFIVHYLPTGVLGLVIAAIFSAAMGTLAGSLNSSASTIVNDLYRPFTGQSDERHLLRVGRVMTVIWGGVLTAVAYWCRASGRQRRE